MNENTESASTELIDEDELQLSRQERYGPPAARANGEPSIVSLLEGVIKQGVTTENVAALDKLCGLYERMEAKKAEREFNAAFANLQSAMPQIEATKPVPNKDGTIRYRFAPFEEIMDKVQPVLTENGFSVSFNTKFHEGRISAICTLRHISGHQQQNEFAVRIGGGPPGSTETQADGAAKTYAKRGALSDALNIVVDHDDDARMVGKPISQDAAGELRQRVREVGADEDAFLRFAQVAHYEAITEDQLDRLHEILDRKARGASKEKKDGKGYLF